MASDDNADTIARKTFIYTMIGVALYVAAVVIFIL